MLGKLSIDLRGDPYSEEQYGRLLDALHGRTPQAPPLGRQPDMGATRTARDSATSERQGRRRGQPQEAVESMRIVGVIDEEVGSPRNDGTRGSGLYAVPLRFSRRPSREWAELFVENWNHPPSFTAMHRPSIARVTGDRVIPG